MRRTQIYLDDDQDALLARRAEATGTTKSAVIRDAIDAFFGDGSRATAAALQRFHAAIGEASGIADYLPSGSDYVDALRTADSERETALESRRNR